MVDSFKNKKIAILGIGVEGLSSAKFLVSQGAQVTLLDQKQREEIDPELLSEAKKLGCSLVFGDTYLSSLTDYDILVRSPGARFLSPELQEAIKNGVAVTSQTKLFFDLCPAKIIGVTGTKGKGTTSSLIYEMLKQAEFDVYLGGNIGTPPLDFLELLQKDSLVVLELSSFQLQDLTVSPHIAVLLMIVSDHMDYHSDLTEYVQAKRNILRFQNKDDFVVLNRDYIPTNESDIHTEGKVFYVSRERVVEQGCFVQDDALWVVNNAPAKKIVATKDISLLGKHNLENVCAAVMAAVLLGVDKETIAQAVRAFKGLEHRIELVREVNGVKYYDDSIATNPESAIAAIQSFQQPKILILGGVTEGSDFDEIGRYIAKERTIKAIVGIGKEWPTIRAAIAAHKPYEHLLLIEGAVSMHQIVQSASKVAREGDIVLLSPACKSFDMFKNYKERGEQFKKEVLNLI